MSRYLITVVMPSLNEEANLRTAVSNVMDNFKLMEISGQIVIVNDGSSDRTGDIAETFQSEHDFIKVIHHKSPEGIGGSFWDGVRSADGEIVTMMPGDGENDAFEILRYLPLMEHVDMVIPYVFNREVRSGARRLLSNMYRGIINVTFGMTLNYMNGTVLYRRCILDGIELKARGFFYQTELLIKCIRRRYLYAEVPYALLQRAAGRSKATSLKSLKNVMKAYMGTICDVYMAGRDQQPVARDSVTARRRAAVEV